MAASRSSPPAESGSGRGPAAASQVAACVDAALASHAPAASAVAVAFSGGRDSAALLDACASICAARERILQAIHVHHGLSTQAEAWVAFCQRRCDELGVPLHVRKIAVPPGTREGVEAAARALRYEALAAAARDAGVACVLLAHHQDDQAETLLLQLARGAGPHGLGGMPVADRARGVLWLRPLLDVPRAAIDAYVSARGLAFVEDPSNADVRYRRNAVRMRVAPALAEAFPGYPGTFARAARLQAECAQLLDDLALADARDAVVDAALDRERLATLPARRARNLLRWFLREQGLRAPSEARLGEMLRQLSSSARDAEVRIAHDGAELGIHRGLIVVHAPTPAPFAVAWRGEPEIVLPHGRLRFLPRHGEGLALDRMAGVPVVVRPRSGGERLRVAAAGRRRSLKHLLQEAGVPQWARRALPLVFCDGRLAAVPGIGVDAEWQAAADSPGVVPTWSELPRGLRRPSR